MCGGKTVYDCNGSGNRSTRVITGKVAGGTEKTLLSEDYVYRKDQLVSISDLVNGVETTFGYDGNGNRKSKVTVGGFGGNRTNTNYAYDVYNNLTGITQLPNTQTLVARGKTIGSIGAATARYNFPGYSTSYEYDVQSRRVFKQNSVLNADETTTAGTPTEVSFFGRMPVLEHQNAVLSQYHVRGGGMAGGVGGLLYSKKGTDFVYSFHNHRGDVGSKLGVSQNNLTSGLVVNMLLHAEAAAD